MADWIYAVILGVLEGALEFLPVSSTGHLLLAREALGLEGAFWNTFVVLIQLGAILAVTVLYFQRLWSVVLRLPTDPEARMFAAAVLLAFAPAVVLGVLLHDFIKTVLFESPGVICWSLLLGGFVLLAIDRWPPPARQHEAMRLPLLTALGVGLFQTLAMVPGVSRSGATIVGGVLLGVDKRAATEFSFFLAIPTMVGAFAYDLYASRDQISLDGAGVIAIGFVVAFVSGAAVVRMALDFVSRFGLAPFAWWRIVVGATGLAVIWFG